MARLYLDEDVNVRLAPLLRARHFEVSTTLEHKMLGIDDAQQLEFALSIQSVLVTITASISRTSFENTFKKRSIPRGLSSSSGETSARWLNGSRVFV